MTSQNNRPDSSAITLAWHANKCKVGIYINSTQGTEAKKDRQTKTKTQILNLLMTGNQPKNVFLVVPVKTNKQTNQNKV